LSRVETLGLGKRPTGKSLGVIWQSEITNR